MTYYKSQGHQPDLQCILGHFIFCHNINGAAQSRATYDFSIDVIELVREYADRVTVGQ